MRKSFQLVLLPASLVILLGVVFSAHSGLPFADSKNGVPTLAPLLQGVTPAVVNISSTRIVRTSALRQDNPFGDLFFSEFDEVILPNDVPPTNLVDDPFCEPLRMAVGA